MTDDHARLNPRPLVLDGLPTRRGLIRAAHALLADNTDESTEASNALRTLADRLPALLGAVEEADALRARVAAAEGERDEARRDAERSAADENANGRELSEARERIARLERERDEARAEVDRMRKVMREVASDLNHVRGTSDRQTCADALVDAVVTLRRNARTP